MSVTSRQICSIGTSSLGKSFLVSVTQQWQLHVTSSKVWSARFVACCIAVCTNLATCMLDVKAGHCGVCYQSLPSAVVTKVLEECTEFCKHLGTDQLYVMSYISDLHAHRPQQLLMDCK